MKIYNILVFPGGTEIGLEIHRALCQCKNVHLFSAGLDVSNHAPYVFQRHYSIPSIHDPTWIDNLNQVVTQCDIDYIFPAYDDVIVALGQNANSIKAPIISSPLETCLISRSKAQTYSLFENIIPVPKMYDNVQEIDQYPVFVKPDKGQGSQDTYIVYKKDQFAYLQDENSRYIISEYLPGDEYTVDCFSDRDAGLLFCGARQRLRIRSGISMNSSIVHDDIFLEYAQTISSKLKFHGAWFFQVKKDRQGVHKLLEIGARIAGTMALYRVLGVNFALLSIYEQERMPVKILLNDVDVQIDRALVNRYKHNLAYRVVYVDFDDTLILNDAVNLDLVKYLYQCINNKIRIILITKHASNIEQTLKQYRLSGIFDEIIHMEPSASKADYIRESDAILIDDSFSERLDVSKKTGIVTLDCSMLEMLSDERK
jgi:carbamoyl-phosphate synthase large subunit